MFVRSMHCRAAVSTDACKPCCPAGCYVEMFLSK